MTLLSAALAATLVLVPTGTSDHYECTGVTTSEPEVTQEPYYLDIDFDEVGSVWLYEESNGMGGLQRDDTVKSDVCHMMDGDTIIF